jgi:hypothetical protein
MKHRSVIAFILLVAALFAAPQISNDLAALKSAVGSRIRGEILHAFLNLRAGDGANELVTRRANPLLASYQAKDKKCAGSQSATKKSDGRAQVTPRAEAAAKTDASAQLAMLIDPTSGTEIARAALSNVETRAALGEVAALPMSVFTKGDLAMLNPPDSGVELPSFADALTGGSDEREATRRWRKSAETRKRVAYVATGFEKFAAPKMNEEMLRRIGTTVNEADAARATEKGMRVKVLKLRRANRDGGSPKTSAPQPAKVNAPLPLPVAALVPPDLAPLAPDCSICGE